MQTLARQFAFNQQFLTLLARDMHASDWSWRPAQGGNSAWWLLGHLAYARGGLWRRVDSLAPAAPDWERHFAAGSAPDREIRGPAPADLLALLGELDQRLQTALVALTPDQCAAPQGVRMPDGSELLADVARFTFFHESYHLGQLGLLRRMLGKPGFA